MRWENHDGHVAQAQGTLHSGETLSRIRVVPLLVEEQVYGPWLKAAAKLGRPFYSFNYDWRREPMETLQQFEKFIEGVIAQHPGQKVQVVAHSMGGLITLALLNQRTELFHSAVFVGVPFSGGIGFLLDMHHGTSVGLNRRILSPQVLATFPSVYSLFPLTGEGLVDAEGAKISMDFFSVTDWKREQLGVFHPDFGGGHGYEEFLRTALERVKRFRQMLAPQHKKYPPVWVVNSNTRPTLDVLVKKGPKSVRGWDFETAKSEPGDGRICEKHSFPPQGIPYQVVHSSAEHSTLLNDPEIIQRFY